MLKPLLITFMMFVWLDAAVARRAEPKKRTGPVADSQKSLDFDGDVVEGLNRRPLDSLTSTSEDNNRLGLGHSYRRQKNFDDESQEMAKDMAETY